MPAASQYHVGCHYCASSGILLPTSISVFDYWRMVEEGEFRGASRSYLEGQRACQILNAPALSVPVRMQLDSTCLALIFRCLPSVWHLDVKKAGTLATESWRADGG